MKNFFIYKKWNMVVLVNNLVSNGFFVYTKKIIFLRFDVNKFSCWVYAKKVKLHTKKLFNLKKKFF